MCQNVHYREKYRNALTELQFAGDQLEDEIGDLRHELRRVRDGIERMCGLRHVLEQKEMQLLSNIDLCERDLKENKKQQKSVSKQLNSLQNYKNIKSVKDGTICE